MRCQRCGERNRDDFWRTKKLFHAACSAKFKCRTVSKKDIGEALAQSEARQLAAPWFSDPASRPAMMKMIQNARYPPNPPSRLEGFTR